jgi:hypothetical protein
MRRTSRLALLVLVAALPLTSCTGADEPDTSKSDRPTVQTTEPAEPTESAAPPAGGPTSSDAPTSEEAVAVPADTMAAWAKEWVSLERTLAKNVDPKVPTNGLCVALDTREAAWFGLRDVDADAKAGRIVFGVYPDVDPSYSCAESDAAVVVDLASREPIKGAELFAEIKAEAESAS